MQEILVVGHVCIDTNKTEHASYTGAGSPAMFMAKVFRQLPDCRLTIAAPYGTDFEAYTRDVTVYPQKSLDIRTMKYENVVTDGTRVQKCFFWETAIPVPVDKTFTLLLQTSDTICLAPLASNMTSEYVKEIFRCKKQTGTTVLLPQGYFRKFSVDGTVSVREFVEAPKILPFTNVIIVSDEDHPDMLAKSKEWSEQFHTIVVVTQAEQGAAIIQNGEVTEVPTTPVAPGEIVSSVGAGDAFAAGFMYNYFFSHNAAEAASFANSVARQCLFTTPDRLHISVYL